MLTIRLSRIGKKHAPMYRLIISEKARDPYGRSLEILGSYNPTSKELIAKAERIQYWISKGAQMSPTVNNLLVGKDIIKGEKVKASKAKNKKKAPQEKKSTEISKEVPAENKAEKPTEAKPTEENKAAESAEEVASEKTEEIKEEK